MQEGISEHIFYGSLVYKFKRIVGQPNFSDQFKKITKPYNLDIKRQSVCLVKTMVFSLITQRGNWPQTQ